MVQTPAQRGCMEGKGFLLGTKVNSHICGEFQKNIWEESEAIILRPLARFTAILTF